MILVIFFGIISLFVCAAAGFLAHTVLSGGKPSDKKELVGTDELKGVSWAGRQIVNAYRSIPETNQPGYDIVDVVKALDIKHDSGEMDRHFTSGYSYRPYDWSCACVRMLESSVYARARRGVIMDGCLGKEYRDLYNDIAALKKSLDEQERALRVTGVAGSLEDAKSLTERLRQERELVDQVTKELM